MKFYGKKTELKTFWKNDQFNTWHISLMCFWLLQLTMSCYSWRYPIRYILSIRVMPHPTYKAPHTSQFVRIFQISPVIPDTLQKFMRLGNASPLRSNIHTTSIDRGQFHVFSNSILSTLTWKGLLNHCPSNSPSRIRNPLLEEKRGWMRPKPWAIWITSNEIWQSPAASSMSRHCF